MTILYWSPLVGGLVAGISPVLFRPLLVSRGVVDVPNERSSHGTTTLRAGGIAQVLGMAAAGMAAFTLGLRGTDLSTLLTVLACGIAVSMVGLLDDLSRGRGISVLGRATFQLVSGAAVAYALVALYGAPWWTILVGAVFVAAYINVTNFMDGVNGISAFHGFVVGMSQFLMGMVYDIVWLQVLGLALAATYLVFLPWNVLGGKMFQGDVGSYLLGGLIGAGTLAATISGVPVLLAISPMAIYLADTLTTLARRAIRGDSVLKPHRTHAYQRLGDVGLGHLSVAALVAVGSILCFVIGLGRELLSLPWWVALLGIVTVCAGFVALPRFLGSKLLPSPRAPLAQPIPAHVLPARATQQSLRWGVLGASGFIGSATAADLRSRGFEVVEIAAPRLSMPSASDGRLVAETAASAPETLALSRALRGVDIVVNAAGLATPDAPDSPALYGANALLPAVVVTAAGWAGVQRVVHLSSAAVQGRRKILDDSAETEPFSAYSRAKALGEQAALAAAQDRSTDLVIIRATSVQGEGRGTTDTLQRIARSPLASVAAPGTQPTVVSSLSGLTAFIHAVGVGNCPMRQIVVQPWEGHSVSDVLRRAGGKEPRVLPRWFCSGCLALGRAVSRWLPETAGLVRRIELMWMGQAQQEGSSLDLCQCEPAAMLVDRAIAS